MNDPLTLYHHMSNPHHRLCLAGLVYHVFMLLFSAQRANWLGFLESFYLMVDVSLSSNWWLGDQRKVWNEDWSTCHPKGLIR